MGGVADQEGETDMPKPMTELQRSALAFMAEQPNGKTNGYSLKREGCGNTATLSQLCDRGYCEPVGKGHMMMPSTASWRITAKGRAALTEAAI